VDEHPTGTFAIRLLQLQTDFDESRRFKVVRTVGNRARLRCVTANNAAMEFSLDAERQARAQEVVVKLARWVAILTLGFLGISAIVGAVPMMLDPDGTPWQMPQSLLDPCFFDSFLIPGIILFISNGVLSLASLIGVIRRDPGYGWWVTLQGVVLALWLVMEIVMIRQVLGLDYLYGGLAAVMIASGIVLNSEQKTSRPVAGIAA
jgi:hypothetical protein